MPLVSDSIGDIGTFLPIQESSRWTWAAERCVVVSPLPPLPISEARHVLAAMF